MITIRSHDEHTTALARILVLMELDPAVGSWDDAELEILATAVELYERDHWPIDE